MVMPHDGHIGRVELRVMSAIELCRTAALGGHLDACENDAHGYGGSLVIVDMASRATFAYAINRMAPTTTGDPRLDL